MFIMNWRFHSRLWWWWGEKLLQISTLCEWCMSFFFLAFKCHYYGSPFNGIQFNNCNSATIHSFVAFLCCQKMIGKLICQSIFFFLALSSICIAWRNPLFVYNFSIDLLYASVHLIIYYSIILRSSSQSTQVNFQEQSVHSLNLNY